MIIKEVGKLNIRTLSNLVILSILPVVTVLIMSILFLLINDGSAVNYLLQSYIILPLSFIFVPYLYIKKAVCKEGVRVAIRLPKKIEWLTYMLGTGFVLYRVSVVAERYDILLVVLQMMVVAISEEYWARGYLTGYMARYGMGAIGIILVTSLVFTFVTHMNRGVIDNLLYRLPGALVMGTIYLRSKNLLNSILFHFLYNVYFTFY